MRATMLPLRALAATATLSALLLAGCSGDVPAVDEQTEPTSSPTASADNDAVTSEAPTTDDAATDDAEATTAEPEDIGPVLSDDKAFEVTAPKGWLDVTSQVEQKVEIALRDNEMTDDFFTNLVVASEDPIDDLEASIEEAAKSVAGDKGKYTMLDPIKIDGEKAHGYVLTRTTKGVAVAQTQRWVEHGDRLYVITFSSAKGQQKASRPVLKEILSGWTWQD